MTIVKSAADITPTLEELFEKHTGKKPESITPLAASGSDRKYFRMTEGQTSVIGTYNENVNENNSYFYFTDLLLKHEIHVPEIYLKSKDKRYYLQQDLGDVSLFAHLMQEGFTEQVKEHFRQALHELIKLQWVAGTQANYDQCFATKRFDEQAIMADLMYFKYY